MIYKGKVDWWIGLAILAAGVGVPILAAVSQRQYFPLAIPVGLALVMLICCYPQTYETTGEGLVIRAGFTRRNIRWSGITFVGPSSDSRSSLALSLDRVLVEYDGGAILIAPGNQVGFLDDVASHCPQLSRRGMDLVIALN